MTVPKLLQSYYETKDKNEEDIFVNTLEDATSTQETVTPQVPKLLESYYQPKQEDISFSREFSYGTAQEMTALGSAYQLTKAGVQAAFDRDETYEDARARLEAERQEKIFEEYPEFRGREETAGVIAGRVGQALVDPVTFFVPWAKAAKAGKIASLGTAGAFGAADITLRQEALYGEFTAKEVALGFGLGVVGGAVGELGMSAYNKAVRSKVGNKEVYIPAATEMPVAVGPQRNNVQKALEDTLKEVPEYTDNIGKITSELRSIAKRKDEIKETRKKLEATFKTTLNKQTKDDDLYSMQFNDYSKLKDSKINKLKLETESKLLKKQSAELDDRLFELYTSEMPNNLLEVYKSSVLNGIKNNVLNENFARGLVNELTKPLIGGITGFGIGATFTEEGEGNEKALTFAMLGAGIIGFQKVIQSKPFKIVPTKIKDAMGDEFISSARRSYFNKLKSLTAASHVQDLMAYSKPVVNYAAKMFKMQGGGVKLGQIQKQLSVEEEATVQLGYWKNRYAEMLSPHDDEVLILAGKITNQNNLKSDNFSFLTTADRTSEYFDEAFDLSTKITKYTSDFKEYAISRGLDFEEETSYGLTQILKQSAVDDANYTQVIGKLQDAFYLQRVKELKISKESKELLSIKEIKELEDFNLAKFVLDKKEIKKNKVLKNLHVNARKTAGEYLKTSTRQRNNSIWAKEEKDAIVTSTFVSNDNISKSRKQEFVLNAARHFDKERTLYDQESRAMVSDLFVQNPLETLKALTDNTVKIAEFVKRFGAKGEGIKKLFTDIDINYKKLADPKNKYKNAEELYTEVPGIRGAANVEKKKIKDSLEAYFDVYGIEGRIVSDRGQTVVMFLQTGLATTRLFRVAIPSMGDYLNTINNSGYKASFNAAVENIKKLSKGEKTFAKESLGLGIKKKQIDGQDYKILEPKGEGILEKGKYVIKSGYYAATGRKQVDNLLSREISDLILIDKQGKGLAKAQKRMTNFTRDFFEGVQLGRITRIARNYSFQTGAYRAMDIATLIGKGKTKEFLKSKNALQKEMDSLGLSKENFKYLSQFKNLTEALEDQSARTFLKKAGIKAADRDALVPTVGNRRLFSQSKDPRVKFLGSFLSWAQAKTSQTNALISRVEQGDAALFLRIAASMPLYYTIRETQISLSNNKKYKESVAEETKLQKFGETMAFSGNGNLWIEKARNIAKFDSTFAESVAPVVGFSEDFIEILKKPVELVTNDEAETFLEGLSEITKEISEVTPIVREFAPLLEPEEPETLSEIKNRYAKGGLVEGKDNVPQTKEDPADRVNPITGLPYSDQMDRLGFNEGKLVQDMLSFIGKARGYEDSSFLKQYADDVKWQEVRGAGPATVQNNNGPARGSYQVEGSEGSSRNETILNRAVKFYKKYPDAPKSKEIEYALSQRGKDLDFSTLSEQTQDSLFYMDAERGTLPLDKLATGELDNRTAWINHWNQDPKALQTIKGKENPNFEEEALQRRIDDWNRAKQEQEILLQQQLDQ